MWKWEFVDNSNINKKPPFEVKNRVETAIVGGKSADLYITE